MISCTESGLQLWAYVVQLHDTIVTNFYPALFDSDVSEVDTSLLFLPARMGDLAFMTQLNCVMLTLVFPLLE